MKTLREKVSLFLTSMIMVMALFVFSNCSNTAQGVKKDYKENKEEVGEEIEEAGDEMQDDDGN